MRFEVHWEDDDLAVLASLWLSAPDKMAVTRAQAAIDRLLAVDPIKNRTPLSEGIYAIEVHPLRVLYEINLADRSVDVVAVKLLP